MKSLVIYDSRFGNTREVAVTVAHALGAQVRHVAEVEDNDLRGLDLLVVGSPTQGGRPTKPITALLKDLPAGALRNVGIAAFDTRVETAKANYLLRALLGVIGFAAPKIDAGLRSKGGRQVAQPEGFIVEGSEGPLKDGEINAAAGWAGEINAQFGAKVITG